MLDEHKVRRMAVKRKQSNDIVGIGFGITGLRGCVQKGLYLHYFGLYGIRVKLLGVSRCTWNPSRSIIDTSTPLIICSVIFNKLQSIVDLNKQLDNRFFAVGYETRIGNNRRQSNGPSLIVQPDCEICKLMILNILGRYTSINYNPPAKCELTIVRLD